MMSEVLEQSNDILEKALDYAIVEQEVKTF